MSEFIQLHMLTSYPPSNLNRDDLGRPKTAKMGGFDRLRISSQSLKRNWRVSGLFEHAMAGHIGVRTKRIGQMVFDALAQAGVKEKPAQQWAESIANVFGKVEKGSLETNQLVHISPAEQDAALALAAVIATEHRAPSSDELKLLQQNKTAVDIALFGRMLAFPNHAYNVEASCQVAHAISVHGIVVEDDYFTAIDDLNDGKTDAGASHISESGFAAALFYSYVCINKTQLIDNLDGDVNLANKAIQALTETAVKISPKGKQNSFASRAYASYMLSEKGQQQPRSLSVAFLNPITQADQASAAVAALTQQVENIDKVYGATADARYSINTLTGEGDFTSLLNFIIQ